MSIELEIGRYLIKNKLTISTAESCTGGLLSSMLTDVAGSSNYITLNVVTYADHIKHKVLNVSETTLKTCGAVSPQCAEEMVRGLKILTGSDICIAITGIAGPGGGTVEKPAGLCYISILYNSNVSINEIRLPSLLPRRDMKKAFAVKALEILKSTLLI